MKNFLRFFGICNGIYHNHESLLLHLSDDIFFKSKETCHSPINPTAFKISFLGSGLVDLIFMSLIGEIEVIDAI